MKKCTALLAAIVLLALVLFCNVAAADFTLEISGQTVENGQLIVNWNYSEETAVDFEEVTIGGHSCAIVSENAGTLTVDLSALPAGIYPSVTYEYMVGNANGSKTVNQQVIKEGNASVEIAITFDDMGIATAKVTDANGRSVVGYKIKLTVVNSVKEGVTNQKGEFSPGYMAQYGEKVKYTGFETEISGVTYLGVSEKTVTRQQPVVTTTTQQGETTTTVSSGSETTTGEEGETTTTPEDGATTTSPQQSTTTVAPVNTTTTGVKTYPTITGAGTTSHVGYQIALNVSTDQNILQLFGRTESDFDNNARLLLSTDDYTSLAGRDSNILMLNVLTSGREASTAEIDEAVASVSKFSAYEADKRSAITFDLSFLILSKKTGEVIPVSAVPLNSTYIVQLPVPKSMANCESFAITMFDGDKLMSPMAVTVENGCFQLQINSLEPYTLIGFHGENGGNADDSVWLIVLLVVGALLLLGAGLLLIFFVIRKPARKEAELDLDKIIYTPDSFDENDIFSGRSDFNEINRRPPTNET